MCLIVLAWQVHPHYPLVILANRDEFYQRPTQALHTWDTQPQILAGRDLQAGGTWLGINAKGQWAAVTNLRGPGTTQIGGRSRGALIADYLQSQQIPQAFSEGLLPEAEQYNPFNLLLGDRQNLVYLSNQSNQCHVLSPGIYGLSNALLDTPWPKLRDAKARFAAELQETEPDVEKLLAIMRHHHGYPADSLPDTGLGASLEAQLSPIFIATAQYGTRCTSLVRIHQRGHVHFLERRYHSLTQWEDTSEKLSVIDEP